MEDNKNKDLEEDEELKALRLAALATLKSESAPNIVASQVSTYSTPINSIISGPSSASEHENNQTSFAQKQFSSHSWRKQIQPPRRRGTIYPYPKTSQRSNLIVISPVSLDGDNDDKLSSGKGGRGQNYDPGEKFKAAKLLPQFKWCGSGTEDSMSPKTLRRTGPTRFNRHGSDSESSDSDYTEDSDSDSGSNETVLQDEPPDHFSRLSPSSKTDSVSENPEKQRRLSFHNFESDIKSETNETISIYNCLKNPNSSYNRSDSYTAVQNLDTGVAVWDCPLQNNYGTYNQYSSQSYSTQPNSLTDYSRHRTNSTHLSNGETHADGTGFVHSQSWPRERLETGNSYYTAGNTPVTNTSRERSNTNYFSRDTSYMPVNSRNTSDLPYTDGNKQLLTQNDLRLELKKRMEELSSKTENSGNIQSETFVTESRRCNSGNINRQNYSQQNDDNPSSYSYRNRRDRSYSRERFQSEQSSRTREHSLSQERERKRSTSREKNIHGVESSHSRNRYEETFYHKNFQQEYNSRDKHERRSLSRDRSRYEQHGSSQDKSRREQRSSSRDRTRHEQRSSSRDRTKREQRSCSQDRTRHEQRSSSQEKKKGSSFSIDKSRLERSSSQSRNRYKHNSSQERSSRERSSSRTRSRHGRSSSRDRSRRARSSSRDKGRHERSLSRNRSKRDRSSSRDRSSRDRSSSQDRSRYEKSSSSKRKRYERSTSRDKVKHEQNLNPSIVKLGPSSSQTRTKYGSSPSRDRANELVKSHMEEKDDYEKSWSDCSAGREKIRSKHSSSREKDQITLSQSKHKYSPSYGKKFDSGSGQSREDNISSQSKTLVFSQDKNVQNYSSTQEKHCEQDLNSTVKRAKLVPYSINQENSLKFQTNKEILENRLSDIKRISEEKGKQHSKSTAKYRSPAHSRSSIQSGRSRGRQSYSRSRSSSRSSSSSYSSSSSHSSKPKIRSIPSVIKSVTVKSPIKSERDTSTVTKSTGVSSCMSSQFDMFSPSKICLDLGDHSKNFKCDRVDNDPKSSAPDSNKRVPVHMRLGAFPRKRVIQMTKAVEAAFVNSSSSSDTESVSTKSKRQTIRISSEISGNKSGTDTDRKAQFGNGKSDKSADEFREKSRRLKAYR